MRTAFTLFVTALVCVAVAWWISLLPGTVTATIAGTTIQTSTPIAVTLLLILFLVAYVVIRLFAALLSIPYRSRRWRSGRQRNKGEVALKPRADRAGGKRCRRGPAGGGAGPSAARRYTADAAAGGAGGQAGRSRR